MIDNEINPFYFILQYHKYVGINKETTISIVEIVRDYLIYFLLPFRELVVTPEVNPLSLAQTAQYHFSDGGCCLRPTQAR